MERHLGRLRGGVDTCTNVAPVADVIRGDVAAVSVARGYQRLTGGKFLEVLKRSPRASMFGLSNVAIKQVRNPKTHRICGN